MSTTPTGAEDRSHLHAMWGTVAGNWAQHADDVDARATTLTERMLAAVALAPGDRVLELASGPGGLGLAAAALVGPTGEAVLSDVAAPMVEVAAERAEARGLTNVRTCVLDLEAIDQPDAGYDAVLCREGLMFAVDPARAGREIARVLRPGGRAALAVWGARERNPWLGLVLDSVGAELGSPMPPPGIPGPFSLSDAEELRAALAGADFADVRVDEVEIVHGAASFDEWWARTSALAGPLSSLLAALPSETTDAMRAHAADASREFASADGLRFPGLSLLATARR